MRVPQSTSLLLLYVKLQRQLLLKAYPLTTLLGC
jgi:hypothetical protein